MAGRFWVGGTGTWDSSSTAHWSASSGGASGASVPGASDDVTFNGSSGGGTVTVNFGGTVSILSLTCGAHTGTLDFSVNNNSVTIGGNFSGTGSGVRTLKLGSGTWTLTATNSSWNLSTTTNLTFTDSSSIVFASASTAANRSFTGGALTYNSVTVNANTSNSAGSLTVTPGSPNTTYTTFTITAPNNVNFGTGTHVIGTLTANGSSSSQIMLGCSSLGTATTISVASNAPTLAWCGFRDWGCTGGATFAASNSFNFGDNSGITITAPSVGGGSTGISRARAAAGF